MANILSALLKSVLAVKTFLLKPKRDGVFSGIRKRRNNQKEASLLL